MTPRHPLERYPVMPNLKHMLLIAAIAAAVIYAANNVAAVRNVVGPKA